MPLIFAYGSLQREDVQLATLGRRLHGRRDELPGFEPSSVKIDDPAVIAATGNSHHADVRRSEAEDSLVRGMAFEVSEAELAEIDVYEAAFSYHRALATLASGREAWVYAHRAPADG
ncbi:MAG TPA: gamma-glutamylcyclotransferase family protein [Gemmatimonadaceae bacterium]|jgi:gamma-glutamylcyclotransferase (GGCT)/AIG2-like uncharacterized protein YtfP|nr:gamma-glutamylcyclotransferase family protein [Gemmatimonadaceae bacterium]